MLISAILVNHNGAAYLPDCLEKSFGRAARDPERAKLENLEILLVDNASTDGSVDLVRRQFPAVDVIALEENVGFGAANNVGAARAVGAALLLLNNDAWLGEGCLDALVGHLAENPRRGLVVPRLRYPDGRLQMVWAPDVGFWGEGVQRLRNRFEGRGLTHGLMRRALRKAMSEGWYTAACALVRRSAFEEVGGFDESFFLYFEDADLGLRLRQAGWSSALEPAAEAFHHSGGATQGGEARETARRVAIEYRRSQLYFYRKHRSRWEGRALRWHLRRKFRRERDPALREALLAVVAEDAVRG